MKLSPSLYRLVLAMPDAQHGRDDDDEKHDKGDDCADDDAVRLALAHVHVVVAVIRRVSTDEGRCERCRRHGECPCACVCFCTPRIENVSSR